jgi:DNA-binding LytR/AlgR family response regulator
MKVLIIEDEKLSADHLANLLGKIDPGMEVTGVIDSVKKAVETFSGDTDLDLLFVDIHLADGISFDLFSKVKIEIPVIFTTAFDKYAVQAFKVNSIDYLLKPIGREELTIAVEKFRRLNTGKKSSLPENIYEVFASINKQYKTRFMVKMGDTIVSLKTEEIAHFVSEDGLVLAVANNGRRYPVDYTLDQVSALVAPDQFFRINRKVLISINAIQKVNSYFNSRLKITTAGMEEDDCIVSRERVSDFKQWLDK